MENRKMAGVYSGYQDAGENEKAITDDIPCDGVILSVWAVQDDRQDTIKAGAVDFVDDSHEEVYWGFDRNCVHPLYPPQTTPFIIPVRNVKDIFIRANKQKGSTTRVGYSCFIYVEAK